MTKPWDEYRERRRQETAVLHGRVLDAAVAESRDVGVQRIGRDKVAKRAGVAAGTVNNAFGDMTGLRAAVMREAIDKEHLDILAQGLVIRDPVAMDAPHSLKVRALATVAS